MNDATNTKWWIIRQPSPFVSAGKTRTPSPRRRPRRDENDIPTSGTAVDDLASPKVNSHYCADPRAPLEPDAILPRGTPRDRRHSVLGARLGCLVRTVRVSRAKRRRASRNALLTETASVDSPAICAVSPGEGILSLLRKGAAIDAAAAERKRSLPPGFSVREVTSFDDAALQTLSTAFAAEDEGGETASRRSHGRGPTRKGFGRRARARRRGR